VSRRQNLEHQRHSLAEIREIMNSMKNLAYMEARKLTRFLEAQHAVVHSIEMAAADFLGFYPDILPSLAVQTEVYLLFGSERGFCGNFNHAIRDFAQSSLADSANQPLLIPVGRKLCGLLEDDKRLVVALDGVSVLEEIAAVRDAMVAELNNLQQRYALLSLTCIYHEAEGDIVARQILPPFRHLLQQPVEFSYPPLLNESPRDFLLELTDHYLLATLNKILYASFMAENHQRMGHLEAAISHLDEQSADLTRQFNALRQEEIIEEIEVILLSADSVGDGWQGRR